MTVYLVGAGPGDPGLLTRRGAELLARADVVVHDRLVNLALLDLAPAGAERIDVGKRPGRPTPQGDINRLLVERGRLAPCVVRLKGGDPFLFGRGGEEAEALAAAGVAYEVVPGVTSAFAAPAYAGIPVTHRGLSTSVTVVTGRVGEPAAAGTVDWAALARGGGTLVILMGMTDRAAIAAHLLAGGRPADTPVAVVHWGTTPAQRTVRTTLDRLSSVDLPAPSVIVVGAVAGLDLGWHGERPLSGWSVVVTRAREQSSALADRLREAGARAVELPVISIGDPADGGAALAAAAAGVGEGRYAWVVFTSANAVRRFAPLLRDARTWGATRIAAVGPATATALAGTGVVADLVPGEALAEGLVEAFPPAPAGEGPARRVLFPRAAVVRGELAEGLRAAGWEVDEVEAYRTGAAEAPADVVAEAAKADAVVFTSSSTVTRFVEIAGLAGVPPVVASIGPVTTATARAAGLHVDVEAAEHTLAGVVEALVAHRAASAPHPEP